MFLALTSSLFSHTDVMTFHFWYGYIKQDTSDTFEVRRSLWALNISANSRWWSDSSDNQSRRPASALITSYFNRWRAKFHARQSRHERFRALWRTGWIQLVVTISRRSGNIQRSSTGDLKVHACRTQHLALRVCLSRSRCFTVFVGSFCFSQTFTL